jgi:hypothetical protein
MRNFVEIQRTWRVGAQTVAIEFLKVSVALTTTMRYRWPRQKYHKGEGIQIRSRENGVWNPGKTLEMICNWTIHERHGEYFNMEHFASRLPSDITNIRPCVGGGLTERTGEIYAKEILDFWVTAN